MASSGRERPGRWQLRLYVFNGDPRSVEAMANLKQLCERYLRGIHRIEVVDLQKKPKRSAEDQILGLPTVVRRHPLPEKRVIGGLSNVEGVLGALEIPRSGNQRKGTSA